MVVKYKIEEADKNKDQREKRTKTGMNERLSIAPSLPDGRQALARGKKNNQILISLFRIAKMTRLMEFLESVLASRFERCLSTVRWLMISFSAIC